MIRTIKVLVVDDSALIRQLITRALEQDPRLEIVGTARDGVQAIEKARALQPDVITLDVQMPELSGLEALPYIRKATEARIVILSSLDDGDTTYQALCAGAVDFLAKPRGGVASSLAELSEVLIKKIKTAYRVSPEKMVTAAPVMPEEEPEAGAPGVESTGLEKIVAIAASTGGPPALERVFSGLDRRLSGAFLVVQHLPVGFSTSLARRLARVTDLDVIEAANGYPLQPRTVYVAPAGVHMEVERSPDGRPRVRLAEGSALHGVRPAADRLFLSLAEQGFAEQVVGVVLTGMGSDGAQGLRELFLGGAETIAQNEETSVVWGMPGAAVRIGAVKHVAALGYVPAEIRRAFRS